MNTTRGIERMGTRHRTLQQRTAIVSIVSLLASPGLTGGLLVARTRSATEQGTASKPPLAAVAAKTPPPIDGGWPRNYATASGAALVVYQPQVASWAEQKHAVLYAAVSYMPKGAPKATLGTIKVDSDTSVSVAERLVSFSDLKVSESNFPSAQRDELRTIVEEITTTIPLNDRVISLDRVLANIDKSQISPKNVEGVKADPPTIFFSKTPAIVVNIDGEPIWSPIQGNDLKSAVNTNWDLFEHAPSQAYYLRDNDIWLKSSDIKGSWEPAGDLPASFKNLPADDNWKEVKASLPGKKVSASKAPKAFVSSTPAELILLQGEPEYLVIQGAKQLLWVSNTDSDVFRMGKTGLVYFLVAGRWFSAPDFTGPWTFATPTLPADFKAIPLEHPRSRVRASVPGTDEAIEAVLLAEIPQTARVNKDLKAPDVAYQGQPEFQPIEKTTVERAVNTDKDIIKVGDLYYMCFQGVWFMAKGPTGPWEVTGSVPKQIYEIPASSPSYAVTYVTVQDSSSDAVVFATAMAYTGLMVAWGCAVWGTGYYYPPYIYRGGLYPVYYPHYPTYGYAAAYNPWTGSYARGAYAYGPYGGAGVGARYNPTTGTYARGAAAYGPYGGAAVGQAYNARTGTYAQGGMAYGPYGAKGAAQAYNPRTGAYGQTRQGSNVYGNWGESSVQRGDQWATTTHKTNYATGTTTRTAQGSGGGAAASRTGPAGSSFAGKTGSGDLYAGHDGNVYKNDGGSWQKYDNGGWNNVQKPSGAQSQTMGQLQNDRAARSQGAQRTNDFSSMRSSGAWGSGSYHPSGGFRGGGRRR
jgi:hypothetical protein